MELQIVDLKETQQKIGGKSMLRFSLILVEGERELLRMNGFLIHKDGHLTQPSTALGGHYRYYIVQLSEETRLSLLTQLGQLTKVKEFLGTV